jgi:orotidine-5'-phosphate decarboxylase
MTRIELYNQIKKKQSFLCVGLDTDINKIPAHLKSADDPIFEFNRQIIDATADYCIAYKPNLAFYESLGPAGLISLKKTIDYIPKDIFTIADAKRGDIGNTADMYAKTFFNAYNFDSITVAPYMGKDSVTPFLAFKNKWTILLGLTSNPGSADFQMNDLSEGIKLFEKVIFTSQQWGTADQLMYVIGATHPELFQKIRSIAPNHFFLVPGVGAQGGSLKEICRYGMNSQCGLIVNSSRQIIYASSSHDFADKARIAANEMQTEMSGLLMQNA